MGERIDEPWTRPAEDVLRDLGSGADGLSPEEAARRREAFGPNAIPAAGKRTWVDALVAQFRGVLFWVLAGAAVLAAAIGDVGDAIFIGAVIVLNATLGFVQEVRADRALAALESMLPATARVRRGGELRVVDATELVPGDVVALEAGEKVPADARVIEAHALELDESVLTGESLPVRKTLAPIAAAPLAVADRRNLVHMNTVVTRGRGDAVVVATGASTEVGRIAAALGTQERPPTPLQVQLDHLGRRLAILAGVVVVAIAAIELVRGRSWIEIVMNAVALAVAAIPEGLPTVVTVTLALGMRRLAARSAIVKQMASVETLGCTTDICSDKTGTLTKNRMAARAFFTRGVSGDAERVDTKDAVLPLVAPLMLCNDARLDGGDPTEVALLSWGKDLGVDADALRRAHPRSAEIPFDAAAKWMATFHAEEDGTHVHVKGAADVLLARSTRWLGPDGVAPIDARARDAIVAAADAMAARALRVLGVATRVVPTGAADRGGASAAAIDDLVFVGLVGLVDPPRPEARAAIARCAEAGIAVRMITGDHPATARAIAGELGIPGEVLTGAELDAMPDERLVERVERVGVFARVSPEHKTKVVRALRARGRVVAMTGDGVNDAPALREAHLGIAMGRTGTEVTKEAATMVLGNDDLATVVAAVEEGRAIYDNILKFLRFQLSTNVGAIATVLAAPFLGLPLPFSPVQLLWVNVIMDGPPAMALGVDPPREGIMREPPRDPEERILDRRRFAPLAITGIVMAIGTLGALAIGSARSAAHGRSLAFTTFVLFQLVNAILVRTGPRTVFGRASLANARLWLALALVLALQIAAISTPSASRWLGADPLSAPEWALAFAIAASLVVVEEIRKAAVRASRGAPRRRLAERPSAS